MSRWIFERLGPLLAGAGSWAGTWQPAASGEEGLAALVGILVVIYFIVMAIIFIVKVIVGGVYTLLTGIACLYFVAGDFLLSAWIFPRSPWISWTLGGFLAGAALSALRDDRLVPAAGHRFGLLAGALALFLLLALCRP